MNISTVYHGFALQHQDLNKELVKQVMDTVPLEKLYLLGLAVTHRRIETLFSVPSVTCRTPSHYWLLALVADNHDNSLNNLQDKIEQHLYSLLPATAIVLTVSQFLEWAKTGHPFAVSVQEKGFVLFEKSAAILSPAKIKNLQELAKENGQLFEQTKIKVREFLAGAELFVMRVQYKMAAFMLHQAAEQAMRTMLIINTGLRLNTHSIDRLLRCCALFCYRLPDLFPRQTNKEKVLFQLLQKAYIETRYRNDYSIKLDQLIAVIRQVQKLYELFLKGSPVNSSNYPAA